MTRNQQGNHNGKCQFADGIERTSLGLQLGDDVTKMGIPQKLSKGNGRILLGSVRSHWSISFLQKKQGGEKNSENKNVMLKFYRKNPNREEPISSRVGCKVLQQTGIRMPYGL